ncbi:hypothetical protein SAMN05443247_00034 [Bradyrhizobium erythrophlei]|nr:hypothetical protein SAMN05443247_00034 [Bradyrhizobium erythrophlei]
MTARISLAPTKVRTESLNVGDFPDACLPCYHSVMDKSSYDNIIKPVRRRSAETGKLVGVRLQADQLKAIDAWAAKQKPPVTRPEAIRGILELGLKAKGK